MHRANQQIRQRLPKSHMARVGTVCRISVRENLGLRDYVNLSRKRKKRKEKEMQDSTKRIKIELSKRERNSEGERGRVPLEATYIKAWKKPCDHEVNTRNTSSPFPQTKSLLLL